MYQSGDSSQSSKMSRLVETLNPKDHKPNRKRPGSAEYQAWVNMRQRCLNPKHPSFKDYGERGIVICEQWSTFEQFLFDMGLRPSSLHSIERIKNDDGYKLENCKWAVKFEQQNNTRHNNFLEYNGKKQNIKRWSEELGIPQNTIVTRLTRGWTVARALSTPGRNKK